MQDRGTLTDAPPQPHGPHATDTAIARVGSQAPGFELPCVSTVEPDRHWTSLQDYAGRWLILVFYPRDFSFVCPTEINSFSARIDEFNDRDCSVLGVSVDSVATHAAWQRASPRDGGVFGLRFALAADEDRRIASAYGVDIDDQRVAGRGLFIIDPEGILQYAVIHNLNVGRCANETLRVLDALQHGGLCPASWTRADGVIDPSVGLGTGRVWGHYRIEEQLGEGGFGHVYAAWDLLLARRVAMKVGRTGNRATRREALAEARSTAQLRHPNVCAIYSVEEADGVPLIVMEYLPGTPLGARLAAGPMAEGTAVEICQQIVAGVAASHAAGIVHGDIKPANVLFTADGVAKVADFGIAHPIDAETSAALPLLDAGTTMPRDETRELPVGDDDPAGTHPGKPGSIIRGTPAYMAPEQTYGARTTPASDVFAAGLVMFELLAGRRAASTDDRNNALDAVRALDPERLVANVPARCRADLCRMLHRDPNQRPPMAEVVDRIGHW